MKKVLLIILSILSLFFISNNYIQALSVADFTPALDQAVAKKRTTKEKVEFLQSLADLLNTPTFTKDKNARLFAKLRDYSLNMLKVFEYELKEEQASKKAKETKATKTTTDKTTTTTNTTKTSKNLPHLLDNFSDINEQKVRDAILSRHNEERKIKGVNPYSYNINLEGSATVWANNLAASSKTKNLHVRDSSDGYYNYKSILNRFSDLGIKFPASVKGAASFSESVGYGSYKCSKSDCTQTLIESIKRGTWQGLIMKEKEGTISDDSHYKAVVMNHFTQMGVGIAIDKSNNRYYIVLHYGVDF